MKLEIDPHALEDLTYWLQKDIKKLNKIFKLLEVILKTPFEGIGKPEPLKYGLSKCCSRRIDREHRIVYKVENKTVIILQCRYHY